MTLQEAIDYVNELPNRYYQTLREIPLLWDTPYAYKLLRFDSCLSYVDGDSLLITAGLFSDYILLMTSMMQEITFPVITIDEFLAMKKAVQTETRELNFFGFGDVPALEMKAQDMHMSTYHLLLYQIGCNAPNIYEDYYQELTAFYSWLFVDVVERVMEDGTGDVEDALQQLTSNPCL